MKKADLNLRGVRERLRCSGLFDAERDFDLRAGDVLRFTLVWRDGTDRTGVAVFDRAGDFASAIGNGIDMMSWSESDPLLSSFVLLTGDFSGVRLRFSTEELFRTLTEASASTDFDLLCLPSSSDDVERPRLLLLAWDLCSNADDDEELRDELLEADFFLFSSTDFADLKELALFAGDAERLAGDVSSSCGAFCGGGLGMWSGTLSWEISIKDVCSIGLLCLPSSSDDVERPRLLIAWDLWSNADDNEELRNELLEADFFLFSSTDFSDLEELVLGGVSKQTNKQIYFQ